MRGERDWYDIKVLEDPDPDGTFGGRVIPVGRHVLERIIQEEVWAHTSWPEDEPTLDEVVAAWHHLRGAIRGDGTLDLNVAERFLAAIRDGRTR